MIVALTLLPLLTFLVGIIYLSKKYGIQKYISDYYYCLNEEGKGLYFTVWMGMIATLTIIPLTSIVVGWYKIFPVLCCVFLHFVGAAPDYKEKNNLIWHNIGAFGSAITALVTSYLVGYLIEALLIQLMMFIISVITKKPDVGYWAESGAFYTIFYILIINLILSL